jgi:tetratricopeptide (TPR) repeat protein
VTLAQTLRAKSQWGPDSARTEADQIANIAAFDRAIEMLKVLQQAGATSSAVPIERAQAIWLRGIAEEREAALPYYAEARDILAKAGALDYSNLTAASLYAQVTNALAGRLGGLRQLAERDRALEEALTVAAGVLEKRPGDLPALKVRAAIHSNMVTTAYAAGRLEDAWQKAEAAKADYELIVKFDPSDHGAWQGVSSSYQTLGGIAQQFGRIEEACRHYREAFDTVKRQTSNSRNLAAVPQAALNVARVEGYRGNRAAAEESLREARRLRDELEKERPSYREIRGGSWSAIDYAQIARRVEWALGDYAAFCTKSEESVREISALLATPRLTPAQTRSLKNALAATHWDLARGYAMLGQWPAAEDNARRSVAANATSAVAEGEQLSQWLAIALARQGKFEEAAEALNRFPKPTMQDSLARGLFVAWTFVRGHYARAVALSGQPAREELIRAELNEGLAALRALSAEARDLGESHELLRMINEELAKVPAKAK